MSQEIINEAIARGNELMGRGLKVSARRLAIDALTDAAQFMDAVKPDAVTEGWWSDWDQQARDKITASLAELYR